MAKKTTTQSIQYWGTGRRKKSIARVRLLPDGNGNITINKRPIEEYFVQEKLRYIVNQPLNLVPTGKTYDIVVNVHGGGLTGQAGAIRMGISRALVEANEKNRPALKEAGFLTRDSRMKERKKYGLHKARKAAQFSKR